MNKIAMRALAARVSALTDDQRAQLAASHPICTIERRSLSVRNTIMCMYQSGVPFTVVGGFRQWLAAGRCVKKGEHGTYIQYPCTPAKSDDGEEGKTFFRFAPVFDISQTQEVTL